MFALSWFAFIPKERRANSFLLFGEAKILSEPFKVCEAYRSAKELAAQGQDETSMQGTAESVHQHGLGATFFVERAIEPAQRGYAVLTRFQTFAQGPGDILQSPGYTSTLHN